MSDLNAQDIRKIAKLARIAVSDKEVSKYADELNAIFHWIEKLRSVDTSHVEPMTGVGTDPLRLREDVVTDGDKQAAVLANAPATEFGCYKVPKMVE